jgi:hypothetical protein
MMHNHNVVIAGDAFSISAILGVLLGNFPAVAAAVAATLAAAWYAILIYEWWRGRTLPDE